MDYEKKYKEALDRARIYHDNAKAVEEYSTVARYENIFPELKPDDETIRNEILAYIGSKLDIDLETHNRWCSYLEKQNEYHIPWYDYQKSKEAGYTIVPNEEYEQLIKQKEQNPAWSEEDEKMRYFVTEAVQSRYSDRELSKYIDPGIIKEKKQLKQSLFDWLRDLRPSWKPSEEQMKGLKFFLDFHRPQRNTGTTNWKEFDAVESLYNDIRKL